MVSSWAIPTMNQIKIKDLITALLVDLDKSQGKYSQSEPLYKKFLRTLGKAPALEAESETAPRLWFN